MSAISPSAAVCAAQAPWCTEGPAPARDLLQRPCRLPGSIIGSIISMHLHLARVSLHAEVQIRRARMPAESRFAFGDNWASYAKLVGEEQIESARQGLLKLLPAASFGGRSLLDIGCGSGLHALAAARLGVRHVLAIDLDQKSVATTEALLARHAGSVPWTVRRADVFDLRSEAARPLRHRLFVGRPAPHRRRGGGPRQGRGPGRAGRTFCLRALPADAARSPVGGGEALVRQGEPASAAPGARDLCRTVARPPRPHGAKLQGPCRGLQGSRHGLRPRRPRLARRLPLPDHRRRPRSRR